MNGFADHGLDEDAFGEKKGNLVQAFDAFPKSKTQYITRTTSGGKWTVFILAISTLLSLSELTRWWRGHETHTFSVEKGVGQTLQINLDIVVSMKCGDLHINVQDAAGDRILAADMLKRDPTNWAQWVDGKGVHRLGKDAYGRTVTGEGYHDHEEGFGEEHIHDIIAAAAAGGDSTGSLGFLRRRAKWAKTPRLRGKGGVDSCRVFGSLDVNKVQGDFHVTARGHGYQEIGNHLDHDGLWPFLRAPLADSAFNFSHIISELSFGPFYPSLLNPLDKTVSTTPSHFHKFQYFLSVVPTIYSVGRPSLPSFANSAILPTKANTIFTNQYAVTSQSYMVGEHTVPGIFFKYDMEPLLLTVEETREGFLRFCVKVVNVLSGVLVAGHWGFTLSEWARNVWGRQRKMSEGVLNGRVRED